MIIYKLRMKARDCYMYSWCCCFSIFTKIRLHSTFWVNLNFQVWRKNIYFNENKVKKWSIKHHGSRCIHGNCTPVFSIRKYKPLWKSSEKRTKIWKCTTLEILPFLLSTHVCVCVSILKQVILIWITFTQLQFVDIFVHFILFRFVLLCLSVCLGLVHLERPLNHYDVNIWNIYILSLPHPLFISTLFVFCFLF